MVTRQSLYRTLLGVGLLLPVTPVCADGILEQLQNEISSIAVRTRSAVVTIEDVQTVAASDYTLPQAKVNYSPVGPSIAAPQGDAPAPQGDIASDPVKEDVKPAPFTGIFPLASASDSDVHGSIYNSRDGAAKPVKVQRSGTGFSIGDGYIVTTADVLQGMKSPVVVTDSGQRLRARVVGINTEQNVALVKVISKVTIPALELGDSSQAAPGHFIISIGNQAGQSNAIALNLISGTRHKGAWSGDGRHFYPNLIEFGGTVGAGASGAPLVDARGRVIGILAAVPVQETPSTFYFTQKPSTYNLSGSNDSRIAVTPRDNSLNDFSADTLTSRDRQTLSPFFFAPSDQSNGTPPSPGNGSSTGEGAKKPGTSPLQALPLIGRLFRSSDPFTMSSSAVTSAGFAIPINDLKPIIADLREGRTHQPVWLGVQTSEEQHVADVDSVQIIQQIVKITSVYEDSPAFRSGLKVGDILIKLGDRDINTASDLHVVLIQLHDGNKLPAVIQRDRQTRILSVTVEARPVSLPPIIPDPTAKKP